MPSNGGSAGLPAGSGSPTGRMPPGSVPGSDPGGRVDRDLFAVDRDEPSPGTDLREALRIERDLGALTHDMRLFQEWIEQTLPAQVDGDALGLLEREMQCAQRFVDGEPITAHVLVQTRVVDGVGQVDRGLGVRAVGRPAPDQDEGVLDPRDWG